jgi:hypothetical protein
LRGLAPFLFVGEMSRNKSISSTDTPDCGKCTHFYITYDASFPYGCWVLKFKGKRKPHLEVLAASSMPCQLFKRKRKKAAE